MPNSSLEGTCFSLKNSIELAFGDDGVGGGSVAPVGRIKVTIYDTDFFWDDLIEVIVPVEEWYRPNLCKRKEIEFTAQPYEGSTKIKMVVDFGEIENPCGVEEEVLLSGLDDAADALQSVQLGLTEYVRGLSDEPKRLLRQHQRQRHLIFPALAAGFRVMAGAVATGGRSFVRLFTRGTRGAGNSLSTTADITTIASAALSFFGDNDDGGSSPSSRFVNMIGNNFDKVFERFDQIDDNLESIQVQIKEGFDEIKLVVQEEFAEQELDEWVTFRLGIKLRGDYLVSDDTYTFLW